MPLPEITEQQLLSRLEPGQGREVVLFSTPMCGTCRVGERMLEVAGATGRCVRLSKLNINFAPMLRERWRIESVPAVVILQGGELLHKEYAMRSVDHLLEYVRKDKLYPV
ncbi:thioredoxin family protein [Paenibacillus pinistramenti]|uniref:thioredoxin family protein n=1 Tax=Paenibacillus pinistramenti TaxID=1768003 RepID=UPI001107E936|nr:thioredoxin family protein [Paenibacillus pinistramenti]